MVSSCTLSFLGSRNLSRWARLVRIRLAIWFLLMPCSFVACSICHASTCLMAAALHHLQGAKRPKSWDNLQSVWPGLPASLPQGSFFMQMTVAGLIIHPVGSVFHGSRRSESDFITRIRFFMSAAAQHHFSGPVTVFQERRLPERGVPAGYSALIGAYGLHDAVTPHPLCDWRAPPHHGGVGAGA